MNDVELTEASEFAQNLARECGATIRKAFKEPKTIETKSSAVDLVTETDEAVEKGMGSNTWLPLRPHTLNPHTHTTSISLTKHFYTTFYIYFQSHFVGPIQCEIQSTPRFVNEGGLYDLVLVSLADSLSL